MATQTLAASESLAESMKYQVREDISLTEMETCYADRRYLLKLENGNAQGRRFVVSERLKLVLTLLDGTRTSAEVAAEMSRRESRPIAVQDIEKIVQRFVKPYGLLRREEAERPAAIGEARKKPASRGFSFILRIPLISGERAGRLADRFTFLFQPRFVALFACLIGLAQLSRLAGWVARPAIHFTSTDLLFLYPLVIFTVLFHELGHAAAARLYKHRHGDIGFCLYLIFPAFYIDLTDAWELKPGQRAVVDVGGIYFQLLAGLASFGLYLWTGNQLFWSVSYAVDVMALISFFPLFKFDGYWLMVDLLRMPNLHFLGPRIALDFFWWSVGRKSKMKVLNSVAKRSRKVVLSLYAVASLAFFAWFYTFLAMRIPFILGDLFTRLASIWAGASLGVLIGDLKGFLLDLVFILFVSKVAYGLFVKGRGLARKALGKFSPRWNPPAARRALQDK